MLRRGDATHATIQVMHHLIDVPLDRFTVSDDGLTATAYGIAAGKDAVDVAIPYDGSPAAKELFARLLGDDYTQGVMTRRGREAGHVDARDFAAAATFDLPAPDPGDVAVFLPPPGNPVPRPPLPYRDDPILGARGG